MAGNYWNRTSDLTLPTEISSEIIQKTQEASAIMQLARKVELPGNGVSIPIVLTDPEAGWVAEGGAKPVSKGSAELRTLTPYKLAVIEPFSMEFRRDMKALYDVLISRMPGALSLKFDKTTIGAVQAPGANFDTFAGCVAQEIGTDAYGGLVAADTDIAVHGGILNGYVISPQGRGVLLMAKDDNKRPLFTNSMADGPFSTILGAQVYQSKGAYKAGTPGTPGTPNIVGIAGDWTQAVWGTVEGVRASISDQATITIGNEAVNLWEKNMFAVLMEIEVGFRADTSVFNLLTQAAA